MVLYANVEWDERRPYPFLPDAQSPLDVLALRLERLSSNPEIAAKLARSIAPAFRYAWMRQVLQSELSAESKAAYRKGMGYPKRRGPMMVIDLRGWLAVSLERGVGRFHYGQSLLARSPRTKVSKAGYLYVDVRLKEFESQGPNDKGWRRISDAPGKWMPWHGVITAREFAKRVDIEEVAARKVDEFIRKHLAGTEAGDE